MNIYLCPVYFFEKKNPTSFGFSIIALQIYREVLKKWEKGQQHFLKKHWNVIVLEPSQEQKSNFVPKDVPIGFEMAEKKVNKQTTDKQTFSYLYK